MHYSSICDSILSGGAALSKVGLYYFFWRIHSSLQGKK
ncbi:hypothetical protein CHCC14819_1907 [Bacillus licheniformis]|nr:hypothetical protein CHCC20495_3434 [Bacillus licheniformis]TWJ97711.1 hypothetical protein CHCC20487_0947 [Bacillus licheniformis]TWK07154.1 hypothetical protein CHCC20442_0339 [Bacillus licheniformis]TWK67166.1 hypothetical protein CHCC20341_2598 [Bacillus licheniformis]TWL67919.1 hypothetical protein CHCC15318_0661 [Bacillus licheniformis]